MSPADHMPEAHHFRNMRVFKGIQALAISALLAASIELESTASRVQQAPSAPLAAALAG